MFEGIYTKWWVMKESKLMHIEVKNTIFSDQTLLGLIRELMALREHMPKADDSEL